MAGGVAFPKRCFFLAAESEQRASSRLAPYAGSETETAGRNLLRALRTILKDSAAAIDDATAVADTSHVV